jgi:hypothetical protein
MLLWNKMHKGLGNLIIFGMSIFLDSHTSSHEISHLKLPMLWEFRSQTCLRSILNFKSFCHFLLKIVSLLYLQVIFVSPCTCHFVFISLVLLTFSCFMSHILHKHSHFIPYLISFSTFISCILSFNFMQS